MKKSITILLFFLLIGIFSKSFHIVASKAEKLEIKVAYIDENSKDFHSIYWGSKIALYVSVDSSLSDKDNNIQWNITSENKYPLEVYTKEYMTDSGQDAIQIYAPYGYCDNIQIQAVSTKNKTRSNIYKLNISDGTEWNGKNFFTFDANKPADVDIEGKDPSPKENWDSVTGKYSITIPKNSYKIDGYTFQYWTDNEGKVYRPDEKLVVSVLNSPAYYELHAVWEKDKTDIRKNSNTIYNTNSSMYIMMLIGAISVLILMCIIAVVGFKYRKKRF